MEFLPQATENGLGEKRAPCTQPRVPHGLLDALRVRRQKELGEEVGAVGGVEVGREVELQRQLDRAASREEAEAI